MNITLVISSLSAGGAERVLSNLANYWDSVGHKITIITLCGKKPFYSLSKTVILLQINQVSARDEKFLTRTHKIVKRLYFLRKSIKTSAPEVVVSFVDVMNITTLMACVGLNIPVVISERIDPYFHKIPRFYKFLRECFYPYAKKVVVQTKSAAAYFKRLKNVIIIPNAVQKLSHVTRDFSLPIKNAVSVGRLCEQKDFSTLIKAFAEIHKSHPNIMLTIYGEGPERANLEALIQSLNMTDWVFLPGTVTDVEKVLVAADLFVFPSLYEGFPNALCEAMAAGLPVIASNCSGNIDVVEDGINGRLFPVGDADALVSTMKELVSDHAQCEKLSKNAMTLSDRYSQCKIYQLWDKII
jgi:GalNAc-alpha-(1->4)-GalNAc-alpha-(1->3)-diNAcBac-PP-undecaprenol alpha-1,4-N-acetyl-D-galactosaminyltransferase